MHGFQFVMNFLVMPMFFLSGALPLANLLTALTGATRIDPLSYGIDGLRGALIGLSHFGMALNAGLLAIVAAAFVGLGHGRSRESRRSRPVGIWISGFGIWDLGLERGSHARALTARA